MLSASSGSWSGDASQTPRRGAAQQAQSGEKWWVPSRPWGPVGLPQGECGLQALLGVSGEVEPGLCVTPPDPRDRGSHPSPRAQTFPAILTVTGRVRAGEVGRAGSCLRAAVETQEVLRSSVKKGNLLGNADSMFCCSLYSENNC